MCSKYWNKTNECDKILEKKENRVAEGVKVVIPMNTNFPETLEFLRYRLNLQSQNYCGRTCGEISK